MANILAIDDDIEILAILEELLTTDGHDVATCSSPSQLTVKTLQNYDLILLDVMMPGLDGFTFCKNIRDVLSTPIIFLTARSSEADLIEGLSLGGDDYIKKPFTLGEVSARVQAHLRRDKRENHTTMKFGDILINMTAKEISVKGTKLPLTKSEYEICILLASRRGQVFNREQIYVHIFGYDGIGNDSAISEHIKNIRSKFQSFEQAPIETIWGMGYKWN